VKKRLPATRLPDAATEELRELLRLRDRLVQDFGDRVCQLHRLVDLGFPEFTRYVKGLDLHDAVAVKGSTVTRHPSRSRNAHGSSVAGCSTALVTT
jgi:hypothetical protein